MVAQVSISRAQRVEGDTSVEDDYMDFIVTLSEPAPAGGVTIDYRTYGGTAVAEVDYDETSSRLGIRAGQTTGVIRVHEYYDALDEVDETFTLELFNPVNAVFPGSLPVLRTTGTILDDDGAGSNLAVSVSDPLLVEGSAGTKLARFEVTLSRPASSSVTIPYQTVNGTATAGEDFAATSGSLTFAAGQVSASVDVPVFGDAVREATEGFSLVLSPPATVAGGAIGAVGQATILDDDSASGAPPTISISRAQRSEADNPNLYGFSNTSGYMEFTVNLSKPAPAGGVAFTWRTVGGTATDGADYEAIGAGNVGIQAGETSQTLYLYVKADALDETDETVGIELYNARGGVFAGGTPTLRTTGTILDDDGAGSNLALATVDPTLIEGDAGTRMMHFEASLSRASNSVITVPYQTFDGTAQANRDYVPASGVLTFLPGQTSASVDVPIYGDLAIEPSETVGVAFGASTSGPATAATTATGTIVNDDSRANRPVRNDVNGDRRADVAWQNSGGAPSVWTLREDGGGASVAGYTNYANPGASWRLVGTGDLNGDGRADLVWQNSDGLPSGWIVGADGSTVVAYPTFSNPGASWRLVGTGDFNGDGRSDLLWQNSDGTPSAWLMGPDGKSVAGYPVFSNPGADWRLVGAADLNGDGRSDLLWQRSDGLPSGWLMNADGTGVAGYPVFSNPGADWRLVGGADLNGDGRDDLLWQRSDGLPSGWLMNADGSKVAGYPVFSNPGADWRLTGASDANGDGRADLLWQNASGQPSLWTMGAGGLRVDSYPVLDNPGADWRVA